MESANFIEKEIEFIVDNITLSGTLVLPEKLPAPCVIMLSGYGSVTRDNASKGLPRYKIIAELLAKENIASFRFDDRGSGKSSQVNWHDYTFNDLADEANAAFDLMKNKKTIDPGKIGFLGHSLGATIGPLASLQNDDVAFIVAIAPHGFIGLDTALESSAGIAKAMGDDDNDIQEHKELLRKILVKFQDAQTAKEAIDELRKLMMKTYQKKTGKVEITEEEFTIYLQSMYEGFLLTFGNTAMYRSFLEFNPIAMYKQLTKPTLLIFAGKDILHPSFIHKTAIEMSIDQDNNSFIDFPEASHDFVIVNKNNESNFNPHFCDIIINWIKEKCA